MSGGVTCKPAECVSLTRAQVECDTAQKRVQYLEDELGRRNRLMVSVHPDVPETTPPEVVFEQGEGTTVRFRNCIKALERQFADRQASLDRLYGAKFSDRLYVALKGRVERAEEELAHVRRELAESHGEEETSETLAIYESFKAALEPFGHENVNVRGRIEALVEEWRRAVKTGEALDSQLTGARSEIERIKKVAGQHIEEDKSVRQQRDSALSLLGDALFQLRAAGDTEFRFGSVMDPDVKSGLIRALEESMRERDEGSWGTAFPGIIMQIKRALGIGIDAPHDAILGDLNLIVAARKRLTEFLVQCTDEYGEDEEWDVQDAAIAVIKKLADAYPDQKIVELAGKGDTSEPGEKLAEAEGHLRASTDRAVVRGLSAMRGELEDRRPGVGIGVVCFQDGRILLGKRHPDIDGGGQWELPGGSLEWGETWPEAARREVKEETGIDGPFLRDYRFVTAKEDHRPGDAKHNAIIFVRFDAYGSAKVMEPEKSTEWGWYLLDKLPEGPMFPALRELLTVDRHLLA